MNLDGPEGENPTNTWGRDRPGAWQTWVCVADLGAWPTWGRGDLGCGDMGCGGPRVVGDPGVWQPWGRGRLGAGLGQANWVCVSWIAWLIGGV